VWVGREGGGGTGLAGGSGNLWVEEGLEGDGLLPEGALVDEPHAAPADLVPEHHVPVEHMRAGVRAVMRTRDRGGERAAMGEEVAWKRKYRGSFWEFWAMGG